MIEASRERALPRRRRVYGVDFSGAADAGRRIWIAEGAEPRGALHIEACYRAEDLPGSGRQRDQALSALRDLIQQEGHTAFGLDFPFGLPRALPKEATWEDFVRAFPQRYAAARKFRSGCRAAARGRELRRATDREARTPFAAYNLRIYRQTFFGIRDLLAPLVVKQSACVLPMQPALPGKPWIIEICPASLLKREGLYFPYKGTARTHRAARARIVEHFEHRGALVQAPATRRTILTDANGDALDSVLAALATARALRNPAGLFPTDSVSYALEGYVYT